jgi:hypothetical protein
MPPEWLLGTSKREVVFELEKLLSKWYAAVCAILLDTTCVCVM